MIVRLKDGLLVLSGASDAERADLAQWSTALAGHMLAIRVQDDGTVRLRDAGPEAELRREPINIVYDLTPHPLNLISNLAPTPFELDGRRYASVEAFWQGLKFPSDEDRERIAPLDRHAARLAGKGAPLADTFAYAGKTVRVGTFEHWVLMEAACRAKFSQCVKAREALLATGERPLVHRVRRDSRTIPGVIMADIWMRIRARLREPEHG
jgi:predicted NAD-dependent protein-ADP-ribosyltransferase YbiA (DUF1768 family)